jgi:hypothetical protein
MSSLPDGLSMGALVVAIISGCFVFLKSIKKCRFSRTSGLEIERDISSEKDIVSQQEFMLNLIKTLQQKENNTSTTGKYQSPRRCASDDALPWNSRTFVKKVDIDIPLNRYPKIPVITSPTTTTKPLHNLFIAKPINQS